MANTFIELTDTPSSYSGDALKFVRVSASNNITFSNADLNALSDVEADGAYVPSGGQVLTYSAGAGKWRPTDNDPYSAGNGLNKTASTLDVIAAGGLVSNASGVYIADIEGLTAGTYGNSTYHPVITLNSKGQVTSVTEQATTVISAQQLSADYVGNILGTSGQINVVGGTGNNSNATLNLVATGVTAGVYGNATHTPRLTVDTYGRLQNVDLIETAGGGGGAGASASFGSIEVSGQTSVTAESSDDILTFVAGNGISITTEASSDTITISSAEGTSQDVEIGLNAAVPTNSGAVAIGNNAATNSGIAIGKNSNTTGYNSSVVIGHNIDDTLGGGAGLYISPIREDATKTKILAYDPNSKEVVYKTNTAIALTDLSGSTGITYNNATGAISLTDTAVTAKTYGNASVIPQITVDAQGRITNIANITPAVSGVTAGTYGDATNVPQITVDLQGKVTNVTEVSSAAFTQSLSWNAGTSALTLSNGGNTVDLSALKQNIWQSFYVAGQDAISADSPNDAITFTGGAGISLTTNAVTDTITITATGAAAANISSSSVADLSDVASIGSITNGQALVWNSSTSKFEPGSVASSYGDSDVGTYLSAQGYATQATIVAAITDSSPAALDTLNELAAALGDDANFSTTITNSISLKADSSSLSTVATSGLFNDLTSRPTITLAGSDLTYDGTTLDLSGLGATGPTGAAGATGPAGSQGTTGTTGTAGIGVTGVSIVGANLVLNYSNSSTQDVGIVQGPQGATGPAGSNGSNGTNGTNITSGAISGNDLILTLSDSSTINAGAVVGPQGSTGAQGPTGAAGATGPAGAAGTNGTDGADGGIALTDLSAGTGITYDNTTGEISLIPAISTSAGRIIIGNGTSAVVGVSIGFSANVTASGGVAVGISSEATDGISIGLSAKSGANSVVIGSTDVSSLSSVVALGDGITTASHSNAFYVKDVRQDTANVSYTVRYNPTSKEVTYSPNASDSDGQQLTLSGTDLTISGGNTVSLSGLGGGGSGDITGVVAGTGLSGGASTGEATINLADTAVTAGTYGSSTTVPQVTVDAQGRVTNVTNVAVSGGGGGGSGATVQRFKLNYTSSGSLASVSDLTSGVSGVTIDSASGGDVTVTFTGYNLPPASITVYGYVYASNKYQIVPVETSMGLREIAGGGSAGSPTLFAGASTPAVKLRLRENETGASRSFGTTTHAWIQFVMYD